MKIVIPGGSGHTGAMLRTHFETAGHGVVVLTRSPKRGGEVAWDGKTLGSWVEEIDGADVVVNLAGRTVNCRYTEENLREMMDSRVDSTRVIGRAISEAARPPKVWLNASTATIYKHRFDAPNDELTGILGGGEPDVPRYYDRSIEIAKRWEETFFAAVTPSTRKVALRSAMTMSVEPGSVFTVLAGLARKRLLGRFGSGRQYVSWIHEVDFARAVYSLILGDLEGPVNLAAPDPLPSAEFNRQLNLAMGVGFGLPAPASVLKLAAVFLKTDVELLLKSRYVVPTRLLEAKFDFKFPTWESAARDLVSRSED